VVVGVPVDPVQFDVASVLVEEIIVKQSSAHQCDRVIALVASDGQPQAAISETFVFEGA
jgi:hypothetical protein